MSTADHSSLVEQVKQLERTDPGANRQWASYCDTHGGGSRDPAFHDAAFLQGFLDSYHSGATGQPQAAADPEHARLVEEVKNLERTSWEAQQKWTSYCTRNGGGTLDPALHHAAFLRAFLDSYDSIVTGFGPGATEPTDEEHAGLVERVKQLERTDPAANQKWASYCDTHGGGSRDPVRHDKLFLQAFLTLQGQVADHRELKAALAGSEPAAVAGQTSAAGQAAAVPEQPPAPAASGAEHAGLVEQIKQLERTDPEAQRQWCSHADREGGGTRDPARHDAGFLRAFLDWWYGGSGAQQQQQPQPQPQQQPDDAGAPAPTTAESDPEHASLVEQIKELQRADQDANMEWWSYCDAHGGGTRDPALHDAKFLRAFLDFQASAGTPQQPQQQKQPDDAGAPAPRPAESDPDQASLVEQIKELQRADQDANMEWWSYCDAHGGGTRDPALHDARFLRAFLDFRASAGTPEPPQQQKQQQQGSVAPTAGTDGHHASLVEQVKQLERTDPGANRQWASYCDTHGGGSRDPAFHDAAFLKGFLDNYQSGAAPQPQAASDPEHARLVEEVKKLERSSGEAWQKWTSYCTRNGGGTLDPALHHAAFLQAFLDGYDSIVTGFGPGATEPTDEEHAGLVERVKQLERTDPAASQKWASYCDTHGGGSRDPVRHDKLFLQAFLKLQGQVADHHELKGALAGSEPAAVAQESAAAGGA